MNEPETSVAQQINELALKKAEDKWKALIISIERVLKDAWGKQYIDSDTEDLKYDVLTAIEGHEGANKQEFINYHHQRFLTQFFENYQSLLEFFETKAAKRN